MKTFVIGDIHGAYQALMECLEKSQIDYAQDRLIVLGDVCDGWPEVRQCIDELLKIKRLDYIMGNHDLWALKWAVQGIKDYDWIIQGGLNTIESYKGDDIPQSHIDLLKNAHPFLKFDKKLFVHGGFDPQSPIESQDLETLVWDRGLIFDAWHRSLEGEKNFKYAGFDEIYLGHTPTQNFNFTQPQHFCNIWAMDTGAGWSGLLTIMDIETKQFWQSGPTPQLYPNVIKQGH